MADIQSCQFSSFRDVLKLPVPNTVLAAVDAMSECQSYQPSSCPSDERRLCLNRRNTRGCMPLQGGGGERSALLANPSQNHNQQICWPSKTHSNSSLNALKPNCIEQTKTPVHTCSAHACPGQLAGCGKRPKPRSSHCNLRKSL